MLTFNNNYYSALMHKVQMCFASCYYQNYCQMKTVNIQKKRLAFNVKEIALGNGSRVQFTSKRVANKFITDTNRFLTKCLVVLNNGYIDLFREYRLLWFVGSNTNQGNQTQYWKTEQDIKRALQAADDLFSKFNSTS